MTDARSKELVEMLRSMSGHVLWVDFREAADELERLREENADLRERSTGQAASEAAADAKRHLYAKDAEIARLREALKPFAAIAAHLDKADRRRGRAQYADDLVTYDLLPDEAPVSLTRSDCKRAEGVLK